MHYYYYYMFLLILLLSWLGSVRSLVQFVPEGASRDDLVAFNASCVVYSAYGPQSFFLNETVVLLDRSICEEPDIRYANRVLLSLDGDIPKECPSLRWLPLDKTIVGLFEILRRANVRVSINFQEPPIVPGLGYKLTYSGGAKYFDAAFFNTTVIGCVPVGEVPRDTYMAYFKNGSHFRVVGAESNNEWSALFQQPAYSFLFGVMFPLLYLASAAFAFSALVWYRVKIKSSPGRSNNAGWRLVMQIILILEGIGDFLIGTYLFLGELYSSGRLGLSMQAFAAPSFPGICLGTTLYLGYFWLNRRSKLESAMEKMKKLSGRRLDRIFLRRKRLKVLGLACLSLDLFVGLSTVWRLPYFEVIGSSICALGSIGAASLYIHEAVRYDHLRKRLKKSGNQAAVKRMTQFHRWFSISAAAVLLWGIVVLSLVVIGPNIYSPDFWLPWWILVLASRWLVSATHLAVLMPTIRKLWRQAKVEAYEENE